MITSLSFVRVISAVMAFLCLAPPLFAADSDATKESEGALTSEQQKKLLNQRLGGGMSYTFGQFANMFLVSSGQQLDRPVGLMTSSREIAETKLVSPFPKFYKPTLKQFLDAIALQTFAEWKYDASGKFIQSKGDKPSTGIPIFEFKARKRSKPYQVSLSDGWKANDKGSWTMYVPPSFPVGMDIYDMGTYTAKKKADEEKLWKRVPEEISMEWAHRIKKDADSKDLQPAKVGAYDALFFESTVAAPSGASLHWRQWVFMADNQCYFIVSTIVPDLEKEIYPDVEAMLKSFKIKKR